VVIFSTNSTAIKFSILRINSEGPYSSEGADEDSEGTVAQAAEQALEQAIEERAVQPYVYQAVVFEYSSL
jgi:hypothetical protein